MNIRNNRVESKSKNCKELFPWFWQFPSICSGFPHSPGLHCWLDITYWTFKARGKWQTLGHFQAKYLCSPVISMKPPFLVYNFILPLQYLGEKLIFPFNSIQFNFQFNSNLLVKNSKKKFFWLHFHTILFIPSTFCKHWLDPF